MLLHFAPHPFLSGSQYRLQEGLGSFALRVIEDFFARPFFLDTAIVTNSPNFAVVFVAPAAQSILTQPRFALYWMRTEYPCRLWRVNVRVPRRLSRKLCCSPTSALQSGWQTVPGTSIATFRVDIDVATCGEITPLKTLDYMIAQFDSDIITMDYRVRGFTRDLDGRKLFMDSKMRSIQEFIAKETLDRYDAVDINLYQANLYHTRMLIKEPQLQNYLFNTDIYEIPPKDRLAISNSLRREMIEIYSGRNLY